MKIQFSAVTMAFLLCGVMHGAQPERITATPSRLGEAANLKHSNVTIRRFDPRKELQSGEEFVLPVDCIDEEHAISSTLANAVAFTRKSQGSEVLPVAFCCTGIQERK